MAKQLKIAFVPLEATGHVNATIGIAEVLRDRGHDVIYIMAHSWKGNFEKLGFREKLFGKPVNEEIDPNEKWTHFEMFATLAPILPLGPVEKLTAVTSHTRSKMVQDVMESHDEIESIINNEKPDVIIIDHYFGHPSVIKSGKPWIRIISTNPAYEIDDERTPPGRSGLSTKSDPRLWQEFRQTRDQIFAETWPHFHDWFVSKGCEPLPKYRSHPPSPYLNIYMFPEEIDYIQIRPLPPNFSRFDSFIRSSSDETFVLPQKLKNNSGKLVYVSMGTLACADLNLMRRLVSILSQSPHRFIVSKGPLHDQYELADNMWGEGSLPQTKVLPLVDLVITHGGNNTVTETFYFGKPMIVMPLFGDQYDNAQRIAETGFGLRMDPYSCTSEELINGIEQLLNDHKLNLLLTKISQRIQSAQGTIKAADLIEEIAIKAQPVI